MAEYKLPRPIRWLLERSWRSGGPIDYVYISEIWQSPETNYYVIRNNYGDELDIVDDRVVWKSDCAGHRFATLESAAEFWNRI